MFLRSKSGPSAFHLRFLLPQVDSPALFAPASEIKHVFVVKNRSFLVRKKKALIGGNQKSAEKFPKEAMYVSNTLPIMPDDSGFVKCSPLAIWAAPIISFQRIML